jgi:hypothetical protein
MNNPLASWFDKLTTVSLIEGRPSGSAFVAVFKTFKPFQRRAHGAALDDFGR